VLAALLDAERGGSFELRPSERYHVERRYRPGTNVLETTFRTQGGLARVIDVMTVDGSGLTPFGELPVESRACRPRFPDRVHSSRASATPEGRLVSSGGSASRSQPQGPALAAECWNADEWNTDPGAIGGHVEVHRGESALIALSLSQNEPLVFSSREQVETRIDATAWAWAQWSARRHHSGPSPRRDSRRRSRHRRSGLR
jgi:hypothetical protein